MAEERIAVFVDGSNFYHSLKEEFGSARLDFSSLINRLVGTRRLIRAYYYNASLNPSEGAEKARKQQSFFNFLRQLPYFELRLGRLEPRGSTHVEKGVDVKLAVDMLRFAVANTYDTAILISGDADFGDAVQAVKDLGKHVELAFCTHGRSRRLQQLCDRFILIDRDFLEKCWLAQATSGNSSCHN